MRWLLLASSPWIGFVVFGNDALFNLLLGEQWWGAGRLAAMLVLPAALFAITNWMDRLLDAIGRQDVNLKVELVAGLASVGALWAARSRKGSGNRGSPTKHRFGSHLCRLYLDLLRDCRLASFKPSSVAVCGICRRRAYLPIPSPYWASTSSDGRVLCRSSLRDVDHNCTSGHGSERSAMITIIDYGVGNPGALANMLELSVLTRGSRTNPRVL